MPNERTFPFKECVALLQTNPKTFLGWLEKAGIDSKTQVDKFDPRKKFLTRSQLLLLAEAHGRALPPLDEDLEQPNGMASTESLAEQLAASRRFDQVDQALAQVLALLREIISQQRDLLAFCEQAMQRFDRFQHALGHTIPSVQEPLHGRRESRRNGIGQAKHTPATLPLGKPPRPKASTKKKKPVKGKKLPAGLVLLRDFASRHHIVTERASAAGKTGRILIVQGKWLVNSRWATEALDAQGQRDFYEVFHAHKNFIPCEHCPHHLNRQVS